MLADDIVITLRISDRRTHKHCTQMVLSACVVDGPEGKTTLKPESISITGEQDHFIVGFTVRQGFRHSLSSPTDVSYIIPTHNKLCIYDTIFRVGDATIRATLEEKSAAEEIFVAATDAGRPALLARNLGDGLVEFKLGKIAGNTPCEVEVKVAFTCTGADASVFFQFPLDTCSPSGSLESVISRLNGAFAFTLRHANRATVRRVSSNAGGRYDDQTGIFTISGKPSVSAIIVTTDYQSAVASEAVVSGHSLALTVLPSGIAGSPANNEFVFVVDCSGSMSGGRISRTRECLKLFIRSLPPVSFFNIVRFGSTFECLFENSVAYSDNHVRSAMLLAGNLHANLGGTSIHEPLTHVFDSRAGGYGQRQVFVLTDGEVSNTGSVLDLAARHARRNRCFTLGIGADADAGLVEGLAGATGGRAAFVGGADDLSEHVIAQLECSFAPSLAGVVVDAGADGAEVAPFPIPALSCNVPATLFVSTPAGFGEISSVLVSGECRGAPVDIAVPARPAAVAEGVVAALFAYTAIESLERKRRAGKGIAEIKKSLVRVSVAYGILSSQTAFVGVAEKVYRPEPEPDLSQCIEYPPRAAAVGGGGGRTFARFASRRERPAPADAFAKMAAPQRYGVSDLDEEFPDWNSPPDRLLQFADDEEGAFLGSSDGDAFDYNIRAPAPAPPRLPPGATPPSASAPRPTGAAGGAAAPQSSPPDCAAAPPPPRATAPPPWDRLDRATAPSSRSAAAAPPLPPPGAGLSLAGSAVRPLSLSAASAPQTSGAAPAKARASAPPTPGQTMMRIVEL
jgi:hypothetical protein